MSSELMSVLEGIAHDRGVDIEELLILVEESVATALNKNENYCGNIKVAFNRKTGEMTAFVSRIVVDDVDDDDEEIYIEDAHKIDPSLKLGDVCIEPIVSANLSRIAAQSAMQAIRQKFKEAEKKNVCKDFEGQLFKLISGTVRESAPGAGGDIKIDFGRAEGVMPRRECVPGERYHAGDRITAVLIEINPTGTGPSLIVSRAHKEFIQCIFEQEIYELRDGSLEIKSIARSPGVRSKVAVCSTQPKLDPVGTCIGVRGDRIRQILKKLGQEKIELITWNEDPRKYIVNSLSPASEITGIDIIEEERRAIVYVKEEHCSLAIGSKGQNVRLAAKLTGWNISIEIVQKEDEVTEAPVYEKLTFEEKVLQAKDRLASIPGITEEAAEALVQNGFLTVVGILAVDSKYLASIEGIDTIENAEAIIDAARQANI